MTDIFTKKKRSEIMSKIGPKNSFQERFIGKIVRSFGYRFLLHKKDLPGKPDIVFPRYTKVIFINGCFWHGHKGCKRAKLPQTNKAFWKKKITGNIKKDRQDYRNLRKIGWKYLVVWQCGIKSKNITLLRDKIKDFLMGGD